MHFYERVLRSLLDRGTISTEDRVLVVCGGPFDAQMLKAAGFGNVLITNIDPVSDDGIDFQHERQDVENLTYADGSFDVVIVHAGLHHCPSPHRALLEMYRVARKIALSFEARESLMMRAAVLLRFTNDFELEAVSGHGYEIGGLHNGPIPNLNYRWNEREIIKVIRAADPAHVEDVKFFYGLRLPTLRFEHVNAPVRRIALKILAPIVKVFVRAFPKQGNEFGFALCKTGQLRDWLEDRGDGKIRLSKEKAEQRGQLYTC